MPRGRKRVQKAVSVFKSLTQVSHDCAASHAPDIRQGDNNLNNMSSDVQKYIQSIRTMRTGLQSAAVIRRLRA